MRASELMIDGFVYGKTDKGLVVGRIDNLLQIYQGEFFVSIKGDDGNDYRGKVNDTYNCVEPIPITCEFIKKNGFVLDDDINEITEEKYYLLKLDKFTITIHEGSNTLGRDWWVHIDNEDCCTIASADVQYVHQLQNLFNIANVEIDIRL
jgi:hypothetical protein